jgi:hypothetical protein
VRAAPAFDRILSKRGLTNTCLSNSADGANRFDRVSSLP